MSAITIELDPSTLAKTSSGRALTARFLVRIDGEAFPEEEWNDFVSIILGWWCESVLEIANSSHHDVVLNFMDGPFEIRLRRDGEGAMLKLTAGRGAGIQREWQVPITLLRKEVVGAAEKVLDYCVRHDFDNQDISRLRAASRALAVDL